MKQWKKWLIGSSVLATLGVGGYIAHSHLSTVHADIEETEQKVEVTEESVEQLEQTLETEKTKLENGHLGYTLFEKLKDAESNVDTVTVEQLDELVYYAYFYAEQPQWISADKGDSINTSDDAFERIKVLYETKEWEVPFEIKDEEIVILRDIAEPSSFKETTEEATEKAEESVEHIQEAVDEMKEELKEKEK